jgi:hypothetical protein
MDMDCGRDPSPNRMNTLSGKSKEFTVDAEQHDAATPLDPSSSSIQYSQIFNLQSEIPNSYDLDINNFTRVEKNLCRVLWTVRF